VELKGGAMKRVYEILCKRVLGKRDKRDKKTKQEQVEDILLELSTLSASLGLVGRLLIDSDRRYDSVLIGNIIDHYTGLISDELVEIQEVLH
jgi:hypothetical protein